MSESSTADPSKTDLTDGGLSSPSFQGLLWTQWLTSVNDNVFRWFVIGVGKDQFTPENAGLILILGSILFTLPYIIFAPIAGWLADRYRKSTVILGCKIAEIVIMGIGVLAVSLMGKPNPSVGLDPFFWLLLVSVFLMGAQSALFAPAKVGTLPELLTEKNISAGNGIFNVATLTATVIGMAIGGWLSDVTSRGQENMLLTTAVLIGIAAVGTALSLLIRTLPAANPQVRFPVNVPGVLFADIAQLFSYRSLFRVALGIVFFWSVAAFSQLNIDVFSMESGGLLESDRTPLLMAVTIGIGLGSVLAGVISQGRIELGLVPLGAMGMALFSFLLAFAPADFITDSIWTTHNIIACLMLMGLGISAGLFDVPLASYLQHHSPIEKRGSILSATNCLAFTGMMILFGLMGVLNKPYAKGSMDNLDSALTAESLDQHEKDILAVVKADFLNSPAPSDQPGIAAAVADLHPKLKTAAITELVAADLQRREVDFNFETYWDEFKLNDDQRAKLSGTELTTVVSQERRTGQQIRKVITQSGKLPMFTSRQMFFVVGLMGIPVVLYALYQLGKPFVRLLVWAFLAMLYKYKITGKENFPMSGGAVAVGNHSSWLDGPIMLVLVPRIPRTIAWAGNFSGKFMERFASFCGVVLMGSNPKAIRRGLKEARQVLKEGEVLGIFPEGGISRDCQVKAFKPGLQLILKKADPVPIVPVYFDEIWGSTFSYVGGKSFNRLPFPLRRPLSVHIGKPLPHDSNTFDIRQSIQELSARTMENYAGKFIAPAAAFVTASKAAKFRSKVGDSTKQEETGGQLLTRALVLRKLLTKHVLAADENHIGVLIPPSVGGAIVNVALALDKRVAINLNYSLSNDLINHCIKDAGIKTILTTHKVADKLNYEFDCEVFFLEDLKDKVSTMDKAIGALQAYALPGFFLNRLLGLHKIKPDDVLTVVFTSGSTGAPKGVMLTQQNIASNAAGIQKVASLTPKDTIVGVLPFFHSMGYTVTLWVPMVSPIRGVYHFNPLDSKTIGKLTEKFAGTILVATPTFLRSYMRRCTPEQFKTLDMAIAGAERLPPELCEEFEKKFGVRPVEGYGTTELSPVAAVNIPYSRQSGKDFQVDAKEGTVGRPMPNCAARVTDLDSGEILGPNQSGMLWIAGPNVMKGYLNREEATAEVLVDGWYKTGDVGIIDDDGFIKITGRMSRFSKIGGEMVPHLKIEEVLSSALDSTPDDDSDDHLLVAVTAVPDEKKGERLVVLFTVKDTSADAMQAALKEAGLPNIFIPSADSFFKVDQLPLLGTGKLDLRGIKDMALEQTSK
jgi:acyl-[acyl-carrier-protein]-phospholipid O-acyltransferase/long-chain-fatty-acid--[acyl-carrier-protein] ligase